jgi:SHS2 domain-containing protein
MRSYKILPHTADVRLLLTSDNLPDLFKAGLDGMNHIIKNDFSDKDSLMQFREVIQVESVDSSMLLVDFLSEILTLSHQHKAIYHEAEFTRFEENSLAANLKGDMVDGFDEDIKAVTYNETQISKNKKEQYETIIVFDI